MSKLIQQRIDIQHLRPFKVSMSRNAMGQEHVVIRDMRHKKSRRFGFDYYFSDCGQMGLAFLNLFGIEIVGHYSTDDHYIFLSPNFDKMISDNINFQELYNLKK